MRQNEALEKKTLGQKTEDKLMKYILDNQIAIGEKIPNEFELAGIFDVGRSTIREAVKGLVSRGILEVRRGDGTYVISTSYMENDVLGFGRIRDKYQLALDLFEVRLMIEPEVVTWACKRATEEQIDKAEQLCDEIEKLYNQGVDHIYKDIEFHCFLAKLSGNVVVETDAAENIKVTKAKSPEKIDGIVAAIMALDRCIRNEGQQQGSVYDERDMIVF